MKNLFEVGIADCIPEDNSVKRNLIKIYESKEKAIQGIKLIDCVLKENQYYYIFEQGNIELYDKKYNYVSNSEIFSSVT